MPGFFFDESIVISTPSLHSKDSEQGVFLEFLNGIANSLTVPADAVGRDGQVRAADLNIPDRAKVLFDRLNEVGGGPWMTADAHTVAHDSDDDEIHVRKRASRKYLKALADEGALAVGKAPARPEWSSASDAEGGSGERGGP